MLLDSLAVGPFASNCYILGSEKTHGGIVIDPGADANEILGRIKALGLDIKWILLTHGHPDHTAALKSVKEVTGGQVAIHSADAKVLGDRVMAMLLGLGFSSPPKPDRLLSDGDVIRAGDVGLAVIHTPGHTPGSICLLGDGVVFSGDTLFNLGIGRSDLPGGNGEELIRSIKTGLLVLGDDTMVYPGHGPPTTIGDERRSNPFLN